MNRYVFFLLLIASCGSLINCSPSKDGVRTSDGDSVPVTDSLQSFGTTAAAIASEPEFTVNEGFQQQLAEVFTSYLALKEALVSSDSVEVPKKSSDIGASLRKVDLKLLSGQALDAGGKYLPSLEKSLQQIRATNNIEKQRRAFSILSDSLYITIKAFGLGGKEAFYEFCPMAFNEEGAFWLSDQESIRNPYFGDKMLTCGEVKEKLK